MVLSVFLYWMALVREITSSPWRAERRFVISSVIPSAKYSSSGGPRFSKGRTTSILFSGRKSSFPPLRKRITSRAAMMTTTGIAKYIQRLWTVTVISLEVAGFRLGVTISVIGMPFSMLSSSECSSPALCGLFSFSFSRHLSINRLRLSGI